MADVTVASPAGGQAPFDKISIQFSAVDASAQEFLSTKSDLWKNTVPIESLFKLDRPTSLLPCSLSASTDKDSIKLHAEFSDKGKVVSAVCQRPAAFVNVKTKDGKWLLDGHEVTGFTDTEETMGVLEEMPFFVGG